MSTVFISTLLAGTAVVSVVANVLTATCSQSIQLLGQMAVKKVIGFDDIDEVINKTDIISKLKRISLMVELISDSFSDIKKSSHSESNSISVVVIQCLSDLSDSVNLIGQTCKNIIEMKEYQESLYFNSWRFRLPDCLSIKQRLENDINVLNIRIDDFYKISSTLGILTFSHRNQSPPEYN